jgi:hypothetical protein
MNVNCTAGATVAPVSPLITDFSDAVPDPVAPGEFRFGGTTPSRVHGGTARFQDSGSARATLAVANNAMTFAATVSAGTTANPYPYNGFSLYIDGPACVDASAYTRVSFILTGSPGTCSIRFNFSYAEDLDNASDPPRGLCTAGTCFSPQYAITTSTTSVAFSDPPSVAGMPNPAPSRAKLAGVGFELVSANNTGCSGSITVTNVRFQ